MESAVGTVHEPKNSWGKVLVVLFVAVFLVGLLMFYSYRDVIFNWDFAAPQGEYLFDADPTVAEQVNAVMEKREGSTCVNRWFGRDGAYVYAHVLCGDFTRDGSGKAAVAIKLDTTARFRWNPETREISAVELASATTEFEKYRQLFPKFLYSIDRKGLSGDPKLLAEGYQRQAGR